jgi:1-acyl-sn-glycerol-3-phosphate acyltransferase
MSASTDTLASTTRPLLRAGWAVFNALQFAFTLAWTAGWITLALLARLLARSDRPPLRMAARLWAPGLMLGAGARFEVEGLEHVDWSRPCVLVANHQSVIDICALFRAVPVPLRFVLKHEMTQVPFVGYYARTMGMVFIERGARRSAVRSLREAADRVRGGATICIFPEGTRSRDGRVGPFKPGAFEVALAAGVPVVPVAMAGTGAVLPAFGFRVRPGLIRVRFGAPLRIPEGPSGEVRVQLAEQAHTALLGLLHAD